MARSKGSKVSRQADRPAPGPDAKDKARLNDQRERRESRRRRLAGRKKEPQVLGWGEWSGVRRGRKKGIVR